MNWTEADVKAAEARIRGELPPPTKGRTVYQHRVGEMNKTEALYAEILEAQKQAKEIDEWLFEAVRFQLAPGLTYTPDFIVRSGGALGRGGKLEAIEVKACANDGRVLVRDDSLVKLKMSPVVYPWITWTMAARRKDGTWQLRTF